MQSNLLGACLVAAIVAAQHCTAAVLSPIGPAPTIEIVTATASPDLPNSAISLTITGFLERRSVVPRLSEADGVARSQLVETSEYVPHHTLSFVDETMEIRFAAGRQLTREELLAELKSPKRVVIFDAKYDPYYGDLLRPDAVVLVLKGWKRQPSIPDVAPLKSPQSEPTFGQFPKYNAPQTYGPLKPQ